MRRAYRKLHKALQSADSACAELEIAAHESILADNKPAPWTVRNIAMNTRAAVGLSQRLHLDLWPAINTKSL